MNPHYKPITDAEGWIKTSFMLPNEGEEVFTKIDDENGCRNITSLVHQGSLWFLPNGSMYVYYSPTHWKPMTEAEHFYTSEH